MTVAVLKGEVARNVALLTDLAKWIEERSAKLDLTSGPDKSDLSGRQRDAIFKAVAALGLVEEIALERKESETPGGRPNDENARSLHDLICDARCIVGGPGYPDADDVEPDGPCPEPDPERHPDA